MNQKKKIAIIGATEFQLPLIRKAKQLGYETYVFAWAAGDVGEKEADHFVPISVIELEKIYDYCLENGIDFASSIGSDITILTVNYLLRRFGKPCNSEKTDEIATNKYKMREALSSHGVECPGYICVDHLPLKKELAHLSYPMIVKPSDRSGSRGIFKVRDYEELCEALPVSMGESFEKKAVIEEYIDGPEYSCESISFKGKHKVLSITQKHTTGSPNFIETGHDEPSDIPEECLEKVSDQIKMALDALSIEYGASHAEFKLDEQMNVHIIEIGPRMGGDCIGSHLVPLSTGYDFMKMVIDAAQGKEPDFYVAEHYDKASIRFIMTKDDIEAMNEVMKNEKYLVMETHLEDNDINEKVTNSTDRHGYYIYVER